MNTRNFLAMSFTVPYLLTLRIYYERRVVASHVCFIYTAGCRSFSAKVPPAFVNTFYGSDASRSGSVVDINLRRLFLRFSTLLAVTGWSTECNQNLCLNNTKRQNKQCNEKFASRLAR